MSATTLGPIGGPRAMRAEPQDVPDDDECCTITQHLGPLPVTIEYSFDPSDNAVICGVWLASERFDADYFSPLTLLTWQRAIEAEQSGGDTC